MTAVQVYDRCLQWRASYPVGSRVIVTLPDGSELRTRTRGDAQVVGGREIVIWLDGVAGCYPLDQVRPA
jgi:hypothetical protein